MTKWGVTANGHLPFQIKTYLIDLRGKEHIRFKFDGLSHENICKESAQAKDASLSLASFFYPNPIETYLEGQERRHDDGSPSGVFYSVRRPLLAEHVGKDPSGYIERIAVICLVFVDIDFHGDDTLRLKTFDRISDLGKLAPDCIIDSGNGIHLYWAVKPVSLIDLTFHGKSQKASDQLRLLHEIQKALTSHFEADPKVVSTQGRCMRIPGTYHLKDPKSPKLCDYIRYPGTRTLEEAREKPRWALGTLKVALREHGILTLKVGRKSRPKFDDRGWRTKVQPRFIEYLKNVGVAPRQALMNHLRFFYGHRAIGYSILDGKYALKKYLKCNGSERTKARKQLVDLGLAVVAEEACYEKGRSTVWQLTLKFFDLAGSSAASSPSAPRTVEDSRRFLQAVPCSKGTRHLRMISHEQGGNLIRTLIEEHGRTRAEAVQLLQEWILDRPQDLPRGQPELDDVVRLVGLFRPRVNRRAMEESLAAWEDLRKLRPRWEKESESSARRRQRKSA